MNTKVYLNAKFTIEGSWSDEKTAAINRFIKENFGLSDEAMINVETEETLNTANDVKPNEEKPKEEKHVVSDEDQKILDRIINCVKDTVYNDYVTQDSHFQNDLNFDSLDAIELVMKLEDEFEIEIYDDEAEAYYDKSVKDVLELIKEKLDEKEKGN